jgi:hypothetical protein
MRIHRLARFALGALGLTAAATMSLTGCTRPPAYLYGKNLTDLKFHVGPGEGNMGIYPDTSVLDDPNNPFADAPASKEGKWVVQSNAGAVASFYSWATLTALEPTGETQFYTAQNLQHIAQTGQADDDDVKAAALLGQRAYQAVLDNFPDSVTYDVSGKIAYPLTLPSLQGLIALKGVPQHGWALLKDADGHDVVVHP